MPSEPKNAADLSPAVVRDEEPWYTKPCTCGHSARDHIDMGAPQLGSCITCDCRVFRDPASPVSVPEERQEKLRLDDEMFGRIRALRLTVERLESENEALRMRIDDAEQEMATTIADNAGFMIAHETWESRLDALAVAWKNAEVVSRLPDVVTVRSGWDALEAAIDSLLDGRTTT